MGKQFWFPKEKVVATALSSEDIDAITQEIISAKIKTEDDFMAHFGGRIIIDRITPITHILNTAKNCSSAQGEFENEEELLGAIFEYIELCRAIKKEPVRMKIVSWFAHYFTTKYRFLTFEDTQEIYIYSKLDGIYSIGGEQLIRTRYQKIIDTATTGNRDITKYASKTTIDETIDMIRRLTMKKRNEIEPPENLICLQNGVLDINDGVFHDFSPDCFFFSKLAVSYDANAACPEIEKFIEEVMGENDRQLIYEIVGATLIRANPYQKGICFVGEGSNGKSTLINMILSFLGKENVASVSLQDLEEDRFAMANLYNKHANLVPDMSAADLKSTAKFKSALGGDLLMAQHKHGHPFFFTNYAKFFISCNKLPKSPDSTKAFYRRWIIVPFPFSFEGKEDRGVLGRITTQTELSGLLNRVITAYKGVKAAGKFSYAQDSEAIRTLYIHISDSIRAYCEDCLEPEPADIDSDYAYAGLAKHDIWNNYLTYCAKNKISIETESKFWPVFKEMFSCIEYRPPQDQNGQRWRRIRGVKFKEKKVG